MRYFPFRIPTREFLWREGGQSVVLVALLFAMLMGFTAMSIDVGRFYAERRFIQNAVDTAALACAVKYATSGQNVLAAWNAGDAVLQQRNLQNDPLGLTATYPAYGAPLVYDGPAAPGNLIGGILPTLNEGAGCRVAITVQVPTYLIKVVSPSLNTIGLTTRAYAKAKAGLLPSVVKRYLNINDFGASGFMDTTAAFGFDSQCSPGSNYLPGCVPASMAQPGAEIVLFGASQPASNDSSFRGYIGLDVRDFSNANPPNSANLIHVSYNGVAPDATVNTLKAFESNWINQGYPGPDICVVSNANFLPCAQIAVIDGSSSGLFVPSYSQFFRPGDIALLQLYDGSVKSVPDFTFLTPTLSLPTTGSVPSATVAYSMSSQFAASGSQVCTDLVPDNGTLTRGGGDTTGKNPFVTNQVTVNSTGGTCTGIAHGNFASNPTPASSTSYNQVLSGLTVAGAQPGIYQAFVRGQASAPYSSREHDLPMKLVVGGQLNEYDVSASVTQQSTSMTGLPPTVSWTQSVDTNNGQAKWNPSGTNADGPITVSWESCPMSIDLTVTLSCYIGTPGVTSTTVTAGNQVPVPVTAYTAGVAPNNSYFGWVRFTGTDHLGHPVVKLNQVRLDVDQAAGGTTRYVDVLGFAAYQITRMDSNDVWGRSVSQAYLDMNDSNLSLGKKIVLVPWETP